MTTAIVNYNLYRLETRQKAEKLHVVKGCLQTMGLFQRFLYALSTTYRKSVQSEVKAIVATVLDAVNQGAETPRNINTFIFEKIFPLNYSIFDPQEIMSKPGLIKETVAAWSQLIRTDLANNLNIKPLNDSIAEIEAKIATLEEKKTAVPAVESLTPPPLAQEKPEIQQNTGVFWWFLSSLVSYWKDGTVSEEVAPVAQPAPLIKSLSIEELKEIDHKIGKLQRQKQELENYREQLTRAFIGLKMNLSHRTNAHTGGWSGAYFWRDYESGKIIGVYKPCDEDSQSSNSPKLTARVRFYAKRAAHEIEKALHYLKVVLYLDFIAAQGISFPIYFNINQVGKAHLAEAGTRLVAEALHETYLDVMEEKPDFNFHTESTLVPDTRVVSVDKTMGRMRESVGSLQLFLNNAQEITDFLEVDKNYFNRRLETPQEFKQRLLDKKILAQFQWLLVLHFLVCAEDPHAENILAIKNSKGETELKAIDNGMGFSNDYIRLDHIKRTMENCHLPLAQEPMLPEIRELLIGLEEKGHLKKLEKRVKGMFRCSTNYPKDQSPEMISVTATRWMHLRERYDILRKVAERQVPLSHLRALTLKNKAVEFLKPTSSQ